jgi:nuclear pore complex protein Nup155
VVELPLRKAQAIDPAGDATNERIDPERRTAAIQARDACYQVVTDVLKNLVAGKPEFAPPGGRTGPAILPPAARKEDARALVGRAMRQADRLFHERMYQVMKGPMETACSRS